jgi:nitroreductase
MEGFDEPRVKQILGLNRKTHVVMIISVGETDPKGINSPQYRVPNNYVIHTV